MPAERAPLILFSGIDGGGKSTQIERLTSALRVRGGEPVVFWSRGGYTPGFEALKRLLRRGTGERLMPKAGRSEERTRRLGRGWVRRLWLTLAVLDLAWWYAVGVRWWRLRGRPVILDRYWQDTAIDFRLNFPGEPVERRWGWRAMRRLAPRPDHAFLLRVPVEESLRRSKLKDEPFPDDEATLARRLVEYDRFAEAGEYRVLDGTRPVDDVARTVHDVVFGGENSP